MILWAREKGIHEVGIFLVHKEDRSVHFRHFSGSCIGGDCKGNTQRLTYHTINMKIQKQLQMKTRHPKVLKQPRFVGSKQLG
jgi:hypothetical protein